MKINGSLPPSTSVGRVNFQYFRNITTLHQVREVAKQVWGEDRVRANADFFIRMEKLVGVLQNKAAAAGWAADFKPELYYSAAALAIESHIGKAMLRKSGEPYAWHMLRILERLSQDDFAYLGWRAYAATWLHDTLEDTKLTKQEIGELFDAKVAAIVKVLSKLKVSKYESATKLAEAVNYDPKFILGALEHPEAIFLKLADIDDYFNTCQKVCDNISQFYHLRFMNEILYPLATEVTGCRTAALKIANKALHTQNEPAYLKIQGLISELTTPAEPLLSAIKDRVTVLLEHFNISGEIRTVFRTPYEIMLKQHKQTAKLKADLGRALSIPKLQGRAKGIRAHYHQKIAQKTELKLRDVVFLDLVLEGGADCQITREIIRKAYPADDSRSRDFINHQKPNLYSGLHEEVVISKKGELTLRFRIFGRAMDETNQLGLAKTNLTANGLMPISSPLMNESVIELLSAGSREDRAQILPRFFTVREVACSVKVAEVETGGPPRRAFLFQNDNWLDLFALSYGPDHPQWFWQLTSANWENLTWSWVAKNSKHSLLKGFSWFTGQQVSFNLNPEIGNEWVDPYPLFSNPIASKHFGQGIAKLPQAEQVDIGLKLLKPAFPQGYQRRLDVVLRQHLSMREMQWKNPDDFYQKVAQGLITVDDVIKALHY